MAVMVARVAMEAQSSEFGEVEECQVPFLFSSGHFFSNLESMVFGSN